MSKQEITRRQWLEGLAGRTEDLELLGAINALQKEAADSEALLSAVKRLADLDDRLEDLKAKAKELTERRKGTLDDIKEIRAALRSGPDLFDLAEKESKFLEAKAELSERADGLLFVIDEKLFDSALKAAPKTTLEECVTFHVAFGDLDHYEKWRIDLIKKRIEHLLSEEKKAADKAKADAEKAKAEEKVVEVGDQDSEKAKGLDRAREQGREAARQVSDHPHLTMRCPYNKKSYVEAWEAGYDEELKRLVASTSMEAVAP